MTKNTLYILTIVFIISCCQLFIFAQDERLPSYSGYVNDFAKVLNAETKSLIESLAKEVEDKSTAQIALVTVDTTGSLSIEQYAARLFEKWGIGQKETDNGILILIAVKDRAIRIETGYGLEGVLPDAVSNQIIYNKMMPYFKKGDLEKGLIFGTIAVAELIAKEYNINLKLNGIEDYTVAGSQKLKLSLLLLLFVFFILISLFNSVYYACSRKRNGIYGRECWYGGGFGSSGGGFGGGFGGFGGGMSGGGGATGRW